jgi:adenylate cyclase
MEQKTEKSTILVVDDTPENIDVLNGILKPEYQIKVALNGEKALKVAQSDPQPDLILLDIMMPDIDGYEVCQRLKSDPKTAKIPIIFVSAMTEVTDETKGFSLGAVDYITKPVSPAIVRARVKNHLSLTAARQQLETLSQKLGKYLSPQIYRSIFEGTRDTLLETSRKKLTIFFSDIVGFTARTDDMESEDLTYILNSYLNIMSGIVLKNGGTLDKFVGDAILVFFGDPDTKGIKEDAIACVSMALEMRDALADLQQEWIKHGIDSPFQIRMGISTGFCSVGNFGSNDRMDYTIIGSQVNLASRLETAADPNQILISHDTWSLVKSKIHCSAREAVRVKGFEHPVPVYEVVDYHDQLEVNRRIIDSRQGFSLLLDADLITPDEKELIEQKLTAAIESLKS